MEQMTDEELQILLDLDRKYHFIKEYRYAEDIPVGLFGWVRKPYTLNSELFRNEKITRFGIIR